MRRGNGWRETEKEREEKKGGGEKRGGWVERERGEEERKGGEKEK